MVGHYLSSQASPRIMVSVIFGITPNWIASQCFPISSHTGLVRCVASDPPINDSLTCSNFMARGNHLAWIPSLSTDGKLIRSQVQPESIKMSISDWAPVLGTIGLAGMLKRGMA